MKYIISYSDVTKSQSATHCIVVNATIYLSGCEITIIQVFTIVARAVVQ